MVVHFSVIFIYVALRNPILTPPPPPSGVIHVSRYMYVRKQIKKMHFEAVGRKYTEYCICIVPNSETIQIYFKLCTCRLSTMYFYRTCWLGWYNILKKIQYNVLQVQHVYRNGCIVAESLAPTPNLPRGFEDRLPKTPGGFCFWEDWHPNLLKVWEVQIPSPGVDGLRTVRRESWELELQFSGVV
jgi:hypothetical protein